LVTDTIRCAVALTASAVCLMVCGMPASAASRGDHPASLSVMDFGAKGDGKTDDTAAFQKAIDRAFEKGGCVISVPRGDFLIKGSLTVKERVTLEGVFRAPSTATQFKGSTLLAVDNRGGLEGTPFITLKSNATLKGLTIFYPEQSKNPPKPYPWTVRGSGDNCAIVDVAIQNPWAAVDFGTEPAGRHWINGLYSQPLYRGVFVDKCFDVGRIANVHLWPFWDASPELMKWTEKNAEAFVIGRTDWEYMSNCFCISYKVGYHFVSLKDGPGNAVLTQCGSDIGPTAVLVDDCQGHAGVSFVNGQFMSGIQVNPSNTGPVKFTACGFWGTPSTSSHATLAGQGQVTFSSCHFISWDQPGKGDPAIQATAGGLTVMGCDFMDAGKAQIVLGKDVQSAVIAANRFRGGQKVTNESTGSVEIGLNTKQ